MRLVDELSRDIHIQMAANHESEGKETLNEDQGSDNETEENDIDAAAEDYIIWNMCDPFDSGEASMYQIRSMMLRCGVAVSMYV